MLQLQVVPGSSDDVRLCSLALPASSTHPLTHASSTPSRAVPSGPFHSFTAVIGPNGAGKSNLMDAISFVLGVRSVSLRSTALKDLIYRSGRKRATRRARAGLSKARVRATMRKSRRKAASRTRLVPTARRTARKGTRRMASTANALPGSWPSTSTARSRKSGASSVRESPCLPLLDLRRASWLTLRALRISSAGASEYKINGKTVSYKRYNEQLESFNILVKAKNFLVFQVRPALCPSADLSALR